MPVLFKWLFQFKKNIMKIKELKNVTVIKQGSKELILTNNKMVFVNFYDKKGINIGAGCYADKIIIALEEYFLKTQTVEPAVNCDKKDNTIQHYLYPKPKQ